MLSFEKTCRSNGKYRHFSEFLNILLYDDAIKEMKMSIFDWD
jgi:hypothetical protein